MVTTSQKSPSKAAATEGQTESQTTEKTNAIPEKRSVPPTPVEKPIEPKQPDQGQPKSDPTAPQQYDTLDIRMSLIREGYKQDDVTNAKIESAAHSLGLKKPYSLEEAQNIRRAIRSQLGEPQGPAQPPNAQQPPAAQAAPSNFAVPDYSEANVSAITMVQENLAGAIAASDETFIELGQNLGKRHLALMLNAQLQTMVAGSRVMADLITGFNQRMVQTINPSEASLTASDFKFLPDLSQHALPHTLGQESGVEGDVFQRWS